MTLARFSSRRRDQSRQASHGAQGRRICEIVFRFRQPVAAICHGPWTIIEAGVARGRKIASWPSLKPDIRNAGAESVDKEAVTDGNLVTARKPDDIPAFNRAMIELFRAAVPNKASSRLREERQQTDWWRTAGSASRALPEFFAVTRE